MWKNFLRFYFLGVVGGGRGIGGGWGVGGLLMLGCISSISVNDLNTDLLGEGQLNGLAGRGSQLGDALLEGLGDILNLGDGDALLLSQILAGDSGEGNGLVDTGLDGLGVDNLNGGLNRGDDGDVVASLLGDLLAVVVAVSVSVTVLGRLANGDHLGDALLLEGNLNGLGGGGFGLGLVGIGTDLVINLLDGLSADGSGDGVALLLVDDGLSHQLDGAAHGFESGGAHLSGLNNILDGAVVLGVLITVSGGLVVGGGMSVGRGGVAVAWGGMPVGGGGVVGVGGNSGHDGDQAQKCESLKYTKSLLEI